MWTENIKDAVIETAAGDRFVFEFRDLENQREENTSIFKFANRKDYVQKTTSGSEIFNETFWLSGVDCDDIADTFEKAIKDIRPVRFTHPLRKTTYLVQILSFVRNDYLATKANEVAFNIVMHETQELDEVVKPENEKQYIDKTNGEFILNNAVAFKKQYDNKLADAIKKINNGIKKAVATVSQVAYAYEYATDVMAQLQGIVLNAENLANTIEENAESMAAVQQGLIQFASKALENPLDRIKYADELIDWISDLLSGETDGSSNNDPLEVVLNASGVLSSVILSSISAGSETYRTKTDVFLQAQKIFDLNQLITDYVESAEVDGTYTDTPELKLYREQLVKSAAGKLQQIAFKTKQERLYVLTKPEDIFVFVYRKTSPATTTELDASVDEFIRVNRIGGKELYELPKGKAVRFYL